MFIAHILGVCEVPGMDGVGDFDLFPYHTGFCIMEV